MTKLGRRTRFNRYEAVLTEHGCGKLLNSVEALMRALAVRLRSRNAPRPGPAERDRSESVMTPPSRPLAAARQGRPADSPDAQAAAGANRLGADQGGGRKARPAKRHRARKTRKTT